MREGEDFLRRSKSCNGRKGEGPLLAKAFQKGTLVCANASRSQGERNFSSRESQSPSRWKRGLLPCRRLRGMAGEVLAEFAGKLSQSGAHVAVQRLDHVGHFLPIDGLVMRVGGRPNSGTGFGIVQLELEGKATGKPRRLYFVQGKQLATDNVIAAQIAGNTRHGAITSGCSQSLDDHVLHHSSGGLGPAFIFVRAQLRGAAAID